MDRMHFSNNETAKAIWAVLTFIRQKLMNLVLITFSKAKKVMQRTNIISWNKSSSCVEFLRFHRKIMIFLKLALEKCTCRVLFLKICKRNFGKILSGKKNVHLRTKKKWLWDFHSRHLISISQNWDRIAPTVFYPARVIVTRRISTKTVPPAGESKRRGKSAWS